MSADRHRALFTIWADEVQSIPGSRTKRYVLQATTQRRPGEIPPESDELPGAREMEQIASYCADHPDVECLGVLCHAKDRDAVPRRRRDFDRYDVFRMRVTREGENIVAKLFDRVRVDSLA